MKNKIIISIVITCILIVILSFTCFASQGLEYIPYDTVFTTGDYLSAFPLDSSLPYPDIRFLECRTSNYELVSIITINAQYLETFAYNNNLSLPTNMDIEYPFISAFNIDNDSIDYTTYSNIDTLESVCQHVITQKVFINNLQQTNEQNLSRINQLNLLIQDLEAEILEQDEQIERWHDLYISYKNSYEEALADIQELENIIDEKETDYNLLYARFISAENRIVELNSDIIQLEQDLENALNNATSYNEGYNQALEDYDIFNEGLASIFSAPMYIVNSIFGFEIFGFNFFTVIQFILSLILIVWLFEKMR